MRFNVYMLVCALSILSGMEFGSYGQRLEEYIDFATGERCEKLGVDTVYKTIVAFEGLSICKIAYDYPERCKICISGPGLKPLIVNGVDGYDGGRGSPRPAITATEIYTGYADIATAQKVYGDNPSSDEFTITAIDDKSYRVKINWVRIETYDFMKDYEWWRITGSRDNPGEYGDPLLPALELTFNKSENPELNKLYADNVEYTDFPNSPCTPMFYLPSCYDEEALFDPILPYDGFKPASIVGPSYAKDKKTLTFEFYPVAYDLNNNTIRVYHSFTLHRGEASLVQLTQSDDPAADVYYTIDGRIDPSPAKGRVYIRCRAGRYEKIVF